MTTINDMIEAAKQDFNVRINRVEAPLVSFSTVGTNGFDTSVLFKKMVELFEHNSTIFYSLFHKVVNYNLDKIEGLESLCSFLGNFIDDSCFKLCKTTNQYGSTNPILTWTIDFANDDDPDFFIDELIATIDEVMEASRDWDKKWRAREERLQTHKSD